MHYTNYNTPQLQLHYITTTAALHHTTSSSCGWGDHYNQCNHSNKHKSNHLSVNQWIRSAILDSQQPTSPIGFLFWNFRHRLMRYYWYALICISLSLYHMSFQDLGQLKLALEGVLRSATLGLSENNNMKNGFIELAQEHDDYVMEIRGLWEPHSFNIYHQRTSTNINKPFL